MDKLNPKKWAPDGCPLVQMKGPGGQRVVRQDEIAYEEDRGFVVETVLADAPYDFAAFAASREKAAESKPKAKRKKGA